MDWQKIHTAKKGDVYLIIHSFENTITITPRFQDGTIIPHNQMMKYNIYIKKDDIPLLNKKYTELDIHGDIVVLIDKAVIIHLRNCNLLDYYLKLADFVYHHREDIQLQLSKGRVDLNDNYKDLIYSGFKYTIARLHPCQDHLLRVIHGQV